VATKHNSLIHQKKVSKSKTKSEKQKQISELFDELIRCRNKVSELIENYTFNGKGREWTNRSGHSLVQQHQDQFPKDLRVRPGPRQTFGVPREPETQFVQLQPQLPGTRTEPVPHEVPTQRRVTPTLNFRSHFLHPGASQEHPNDHEQLPPQLEPFQHLHHEHKHLFQKLKRSPESISRVQQGTRRRQLPNQSQPE
jgi:hypothetical protein